ncbi:MAG: HPr family phosphocarrier protein [Endomicrobiia bacterium]
MIEKTFIVKNKLGLHARPAGLFVQTVNKYKSQVRVFKNDQEVDGKSIMGLITLAAEYGSVLKIIVDGEDEKELLEELTKLFENNFNE